MNAWRDYIHCTALTGLICDIQTLKPKVLALGYKLASISGRYLFRTYSSWLHWSRSLVVVRNQTDQAPLGATHSAAIWCNHGSHLRRFHRYCRNATNVRLLTEPKAISLSSTILRDRLDAFRYHRNAHMSQPASAGLLFCCTRLQPEWYGLQTPKLASAELLNKASAIKAEIVVRNVD